MNQLLQAATPAAQQASPLNLAVMPWRQKPRRLKPTGGNALEQLLSGLYAGAHGDAGPVSPYANVGGGGGVGGGYGVADYGTGTYG